MVTKPLRPPIIIMGMHRSGTSMVCRMLEELGLFVGVKKDPNNEALFFLRLNDWLLNSMGGRWDYPQPFRAVLEQLPVREFFVDYLRLTVSSPRIIPYLGVRDYLRYRSLYNVNVAWGWKDPRNTFTLPLWLSVFPGAKVIHVLRHGVDVANSLMNRQQDFEEVLAAARARFAQLRWTYMFRPMRRGFGMFYRPYSLEDGFALWEEYVSQARALLDGFSGQALEVKFEDVLEDPCESFQKLAAFCALPVTNSEIAAVAAKVMKKRAYAYREIPSLWAFARQASNRLAMFGY